MHVLLEGVFFFCPLHPEQSQLSCRRWATGCTRFHSNSAATVADAVPPAISPYIRNLQIRVRQAIYCYYLFKRVSNRGEEQSRGIRP